MWSFLAGKVLRNRLAFLIVVVLITAFMGYKAQFIEMSYTYAALLPETDTAYINLKDFNAKFGADANVMVVGFKDKAFFKTDKFNDWQKLIRKLKKDTAIINVFSVSDAYRVKKDAKLKKFKFSKIFPDTIKSQQQLDSLKDELYQYPFFDNLVYMRDSSFYILAITIENKVIDSKKRKAFMNRTEQPIRDFAQKYNLDVKMSGLPYTRTRIAQMIEHELLMFVLLAVFVTAFIMFLFFRSLRVVAFSMLIVGAGVIWSLGTLALFGFKITILTSMIPPLIIVIGIPNSVFLLNKYHHEFKLHQNKIKALHRVIAKVGNATFLTNLTTAAGFATFIVTGNHLLVEVGIVTALNILGVFILSVTLIPVFFSFMPAPKERHLRHLDYKFVGKIVEWFVSVVQYKRKLIYSVVVLFVLIAVGGIFRMKTQGLIINDIPEDNPIFADMKFFEQTTGGIMPFEIMVAKTNADTLDYPDINRINNLQNELKKYSFFSKSLSIADAMKFANQAYYNSKKKAYRFPKMSDASRLKPYISNMKGDNKLMTAFLDSSLSIARISLRMKDIGLKKMNKLQSGLQIKIDSIFPEKEYNVVMTGSSIVFTKSTGKLIDNLFTSLALAVVLISIFMASMFASFRMIILTLIPNLLPLIFTAALMGYFGVPLKPSTILVFSIAFGISVDNAIHFLAKYRQELQVNDWNIKISVLNALRETGVSIVYTATILFFGFGIFTQSEFGGTVALGVLVSVTLLFALLSNLLFLPALLLSFDNRITTESFKIDLLKKHIENPENINEPDEN